MNSVPLIGQQALMAIPCPARGKDGAHIMTKPDGSLELCGFCGGYGMIAVNPRALRIVEISSDATPARLQATEAAAH